MKCEYVNCISFPSFCYYTITTILLHSSESETYTIHFPYDTSIPALGFLYPYVHSFKL